MELDEVVRALLDDPADVEVARRTLPEVNGLYAWWTDTGAIPGVPARPHPRYQALELFYVGIAPRDAKSSATLKSRIVKNHLGGNTGSSTFRFTLAALLMDPLELIPERTKTKYVLPTSQNQAPLKAWQREHLKLSWVGHDQPWLIEGAVIEALSPPLNLAGNSSHPFHPTLSDARAKFRNAARPLT